MGQKERAKWVLKNNPTVDYLFCLIFCEARSMKLIKV